MFTGLLAPHLKEKKRRIEVGRGRKGEVNIKQWDHYSQGHTFGSCIQHKLCCENHRVSQQTMKS